MTISNRYRLSTEELVNLHNEQRHAGDKCYADRLKAVYLLGKNWQVSDVAEALLIDKQSVRNHYKRYRKGGLKGLLSNEPKKIISPMR